MKKEKKIVRNWSFRGYLSKEAQGVIRKVQAQFMLDRAEKIGQDEVVDAIIRDFNHTVILKTKN